MIQNHVPPNVGFDGATHGAVPEQQPTLEQRRTNTMRAARSAYPKDFERSSSNPRSDPAGAQMAKPQVRGTTLSEANWSPFHYHSPYPP